VALLFSLPLLATKLLSPRIKLGYTGRHSATIIDMFQDAFLQRVRIACNAERCTSRAILSVRPSRSGV